MIRRGRNFSLLWLVVAVSVLALHLSAHRSEGGVASVRVGDALTDAGLISREGRKVRLTDTHGRIKLISIVPQLNTPVCDEQTHRFSEQNGGIDRSVDILTISTNSAEDQARFARKANIRNITFLSDVPAYDFGKQTGLLLPMYGILHRAVIVTDRENIIRYVELVPMGQLPNFEAALDAVHRLLAKQKGQGDS